MTHQNLIVSLASTVLLSFLMCFDAAAQSESAPELTSLEGKTVELVYADGSAEWPLKITELVAGTAENSIKSIRIQFKKEKKQRKITVKKIAEIILDDQPLDVQYDKKKRALVHSPAKRKERLEYLAEVKARLEGGRHRMWRPLTEKQHAKFLHQQKEMIEKTKSHFPNHQFHTVETEFFIVCTDLSATKVGGYLASLDDMYSELCLAFGLAPAKKIWAGKCLVFAFAQEAEYLEFEAAIFSNHKAKGTQGLCHQSSNGSVVFAGFRGDSDKSFAITMVHETAHGFVHRYFSSARAPSWLNEGMSDWIANAIMKSDIVPSKQIQSAITVRETGSWGDFLTTDRIEGKFYGSASTLVEILLRRDKGGQFREFFRGIKEGKAAEESLKDAYGLSYQDLVILYAQQLKKLPKRLPRRRR